MCGRGRVRVLGEGGGPEPSTGALENGGPEIKLQLLHYPPLDLVTATRKKPSPRGAKAALKPWMGDIFDAAYIPDPAQRRDRLASPAWGSNADDIAGIAPALVVTAEYDRLREEAWRYAQKLDAVGSLVEYREVRGVDHGYNIMSNDAAVTRDMYAVMAKHVRRAVGS